MSDKPEAATAQMTETLTSVKDFLEAVAVLTAIGVAYLTSSHQLAFLVVTFIITGLSFIFALWMIRNRNRASNRSQSAVITRWLAAIIFLCGICASANKISNWKSIRAPATLSDVRTSNIRLQAPHGSEVIALTAGPPRFFKNGLLIDTADTSVTFMVTKKTWVESLRVASVRVTVIDFLPLPKDWDAAFRAEQLNVTSPACYEVVIEDGLPRRYEARLAVKREEIVGFVAMQKDNPYLMGLINFDSRVAGFVKARIEVDVIENDSTEPVTIRSNIELRVFVHALPKDNEEHIFDPKKEMIRPDPTKEKKPN